MHFYRLHLFESDFELECARLLQSICPGQGRDPSQNHRKAEVGKDLWRSSGPTPLLRQGHLDPDAQDNVQTAFQYFQRWRLHTSLENLCQHLVNLTVKKCFLVPIASVPVTGHH